MALKESTSFNGKVLMHDIANNMRGFRQFDRTCLDLAVNCTLNYNGIGNHLALYVGALTNQ